MRADEEGLLEAERAVMQAIAHQDGSALEQLVAPGFVLRLPGEGAVDREGFLAMVLEIPGQIESIQGRTR